MEEGGEIQVGERNERGAVLGEENGRKCRLCGRGIESWKHVWKSCKNWGKVGEESW